MTGIHQRSACFFGSVFCIFSKAIIAFVLTSLLLLTTGTAADTIQVQNVQITTIGDTVPVNIVLDTTPAGVAGYDISVSLSDESVATITGVSFPSWALLNENTTLPASSIRMRAVDLDEEIDSGAKAVHFGTITLRGDAIGSTDIVVTINSITSDDGENFSPSVMSGTLTVGESSAYPAPIIANHTKIRLSQIPLPAINASNENLHIAYWHTSHGSQITTGMTGLTGFSGAPYGSSTYLYNSGGTGDALDLREPSSTDLGNSNWATVTRNYLTAHPEINVIMWSWCGQVSTSSEASINSYLSQMNQLETDYPNVKFVYMTGHLNGDGSLANTNLRNEQIRSYARANNKILFDFADIESYDPDGFVNYMELLANDNCDYDSDGDESLDTNWATEWQNSHIEGTDWYSCSAAHSQALNANQKAYAAWWLWARLAGWDGITESANQKTQIGVHQNFYWYLDTDGSYAWNSSDRSFTWGQTGDTPITGDWNGDGKKEAGVFRNGVWILDYDGSGSWSASDKVGFYGGAGSIPVIGDWNGDKKDDIGTYQDVYWYLDTDGSYAWNSGDRSFTWGQTGDTPITGDWNGDGKKEAGVFRNGVWILDYDGSGSWSALDKVGFYGGAGSIPVIGDWNGDKKDDIGMYQDVYWYLDTDGSYAWNSGDRSFSWGQTGDTPITGDWNGDGKKEVGVFRNGIWILDYDGSGSWSALDKVGYYGGAGSTPIIGKW